MQKKKFIEGDIFVQRDFSIVADTPPQCHRIYAYIYLRQYYNNIKRLKSTTRDLIINRKMCIFVHYEFRKKKTKLCHMDKRALIKSFLANQRYIQAYSAFVGGELIQQKRPSAASSDVYRSFIHANLIFNVQK